MKRKTCQDGKRGGLPSSEILEFSRLVFRKGAATSLAMHRHAHPTHQQYRTLLRLSSLPFLQQAFNFLPKSHSKTISILALCGVLFEASHRVIVSPQILLTREKSWLCCPFTRLIPVVPSVRRMVLSASPAPKCDASSSLHMMLQRGDTLG